MKGYRRESVMAYIYIIRPVDFRILTIQQRFIFQDVRTLTFEEVIAIGEAGQGYHLTLFSSLFY